VRPDVLVLLGATAGKALLGSGFKLGEARGSAIESDLAPVVTATAHPSAILRMPDHAARERARAELRSDLAVVAEALRDPSAA
jgi:uracil-DNA glycosylase